MKRTEVVRCRGHPCVRGDHPTTFEVTTEEHLSCTGNCIIGVGADKGAADLCPEFKEAMADDRAELLTTLSAGGTTVVIRSRGHPGMAFDHPTDLVWRRSDFVCGRTVGIGSDQVARTLPRALIAALSEGEEMEVTLTVTIPDSEG
jgi:hypothetical protein